MWFDPNETERFRRSTERVTKQDGITQPYRRCAKCGNRVVGLKKVKGTGTSRHNPARWECVTCP